VPLPTDPAAPWPPLAWRAVAADIDTAAVWWEGDEARLVELYGRPQAAPARKTLAARVRFWARRADDQNTDRTRLHVPLAADALR